MQLRTDLNSAGPVKPVGRVDTPARTDGVAEPRHAELQRVLAPLLGKSMVAQVLARMSDGNFVVKVDGNPMRMMLPPGTKVGADVALTLLAVEPRPTFQVGDNPKSVTASPFSPNDAPVKGSGLPGQGAASGTGQANSVQAALLKTTAAVALTPGEAGGPAPVLSATGRVLSSVLSAAQNAPGAALALEGTQPLISHAAPDPAQLASKLQQTISQSGLFYESHLAEWAEGTRSMTELLHEPQTTRAPAPPTEPATAQFINLQLTSQEQSRVAWQGQLSPGHELDWHIEKDASQQRGGDGPDTPVWRSGMKFRLPLLGEIAATVVMVGDKCQIEIQTGSDDVGTRLRAHAAELTGAMQAAGTPLTALSIGVKRDAEDGDG